MKIKSKRERNGKEECRCNTGDYCPAHQRYSTRIAPNNYYEEEIRIHADQRCGGGRRVIRKELGTH